MATQRLIPPQAGAWLNQSEGLAALLPAAQQAMRLEARLKQVLPPGLRDAVQISLKNPQAPILFVPSSAVASKIKQLIPRLVAQLQAQGIPCNDLTVKVSREPVAAEKPEKQAALSQRGLAHFEQLHASLEEGTVKTALGSMIQHQKS